MGIFQVLGHVYVPQNAVAGLTLCSEERGARIGGIRRCSMISSLSYIGQA